MLGYELKKTTLLTRLILLRCWHLHLYYIRWDV